MPITLSELTLFCVAEAFPGPSGHNRTACTQQMYPACNLVKIPCAKRDHEPMLFPSVARWWPLICPHAAQTHLIHLYNWAYLQHSTHPLKTVLFRCIWPLLCNHHNPLIIKDRYWEYSNPRDNGREVLAGMSNLLLGVGNQRNRLKTKLVKTKWPTTKQHHNHGANTQKKTIRQLNWVIKEILCGIKDSFHLLMKFLHSKGPWTLILLSQSCSNPVVNHQCKKKALTFSMWWRLKSFRQVLEIGALNLLNDLGSYIHNW